MLQLLPLLLLLLLLLLLKFRKSAWCVRSGIHAKVWSLFGEYGLGYGGG